MPKQSHSQRDCKQCSSAFTPVNLRQKYCGADCRKDAGKELVRERYNSNAAFRSQRLDECRRYYSAMPEGVKAKRRRTQKRYKMAHPEKDRAYRSRRRAAMREALHPEHDPRREEWLHKLARRLGRMTGESWQVDHIVPIARGGAHHHDNLQVIPQKWNAAKQADPYWKPSPCPSWFTVPDMEAVMYGGVV